MTDAIARDGADLFDRWMRATKSIETARSNLNKAECERTNATTALARWMLPDDAAIGEKISVWQGSSLIQVECTQAGSMRDGKVTLRTKGRDRI